MARALPSRTRHAWTPYTVCLGELIKGVWDCCGAKKMARARHLTVDWCKKCCFNTGPCPIFEIFVISGANQQSQSVQKTSSLVRS